MVDITAEAVLAVEANPENIRNITGALNDLVKAASQAQRAIAAASGPAPAQAPRAQAGLFEQLKQFAANLGGKMSGAFATGVEQAAKAPLDVLKTSTRLVQQSLLNMTGGAGRFVQQAGLTSTAVVGVGVAIAGLAGPLVSLVGGIKLLRSSFGWAKAAAEEQMTIAGRARRFYPEAFGAGLEEAEEKMAVSMRTATALIGEGADSLQESLTRRLAPARLARGIRGDRDIFSRWGITPQAIARYEKMTGGRIDLTQWLEFFVLKREKLESDIENAKTPQERDLATRKLSTLMDDSLKIFDASFAKAVGVVNSRDIEKIKTNLRAAKEISYVPGATRNTVEFNIALKTLGQTFAEITEGIGQMVQPTVTRFLNDLNRKLLPTKVGGEGLAEMFKELAASMAVRAWQALHTIMRKITPERVNDWIKEITSWNAEKTADNLLKVFDAILAVSEAATTIITAIKALYDILPPGTIKGALAGGAGGFLAGGPVGAVAGAAGGAVLGAGVGAMQGVGGGEAPPAGAPATMGAPGGGGWMDTLKNIFSIGKAQASTIPGGAGQPAGGDVWNQGQQQQAATFDERFNAAVQQGPMGGLTQGLAPGQEPGQTVPQPAVPPRTEAKQDNIEDVLKVLQQTQQPRAQPAAEPAAGAAVTGAAPLGGRLPSAEPTLAPGGPQVTQYQPAAPTQPLGGTLPTPAPNLPPPTFGERYGEWPQAPAIAQPTAPTPPLGGTLPTPAPNLPAQGAPAQPAGVPSLMPTPPPPPAPTFGERFGEWTQPQAAAQPALGAPPAITKQEPAIGPPPAVSAGPPATGEVPQALQGPPESRWQSLKRKIFPGKRAETSADLIQTAQANLEWRPQAQAAMQGAAATQMAGQMAMTTTMEHRGGHDELVMKPAVMRNPEGNVNLRDMVMQASMSEVNAAGSDHRSGLTEAQRSKAYWGTYLAGAAASFVPGLGTAGAIAHATGRAAFGEQEPTFGETIRGVIPGMGMLEMMKRDQEAGHPVRDQLREMLGIDPEQEGVWNPARRLYGESPYATDTSFEGRYGTWPPASGGGITAADGTQFGTAAADALKTGLDGVSIGGPSSTTWGVTPQQATPPRGGDPPTEA